LLGDCVRFTGLADWGGLSRKTGYAVQAPSDAAGGNTPHAESTFARSPSARSSIRARVQGNIPDAYLFRQIRREHGLELARIGRLLPQPFWPRVGLQDHRHTVVRLRAQLVGRGCDDREAALTRRRAPRLRSADAPRARRTPPTVTRSVGTSGAGRDSPQPAGGALEAPRGPIEKRALPPETRLFVAAVAAQRV